MHSFIRFTLAVLIFILFYTSLIADEFGISPCNAPVKETTENCKFSDKTVYESQISDLNDNFVDTPFCSSNEVPNDGWVKFTATTTITSIKWRDGATGSGESDLNHALYIYNGPCNNLELIVCRDKYDEGYFEWITFSTNVGSTYYIRVKLVISGSAALTEMKGTLCVNAQDIQSDCGNCASPDCSIVGPLSNLAEATHGLDNGLICSDNPDPLVCDFYCPGISGSNIFSNCYEVTTGSEGTIGAVRWVATGSCLEQNQIDRHIAGTIGMELFQNCNAPIHPSSEFTFYENSIAFNDETYFAEWYDLTPNSNYTLCIHHSVSTDCRYDGMCPRYYYPEAPNKECPTSNFQDPSISYLCSGDILSLPQEGQDFIIDDPDEIAVGDVQWFIGTDPTIAPSYNNNFPINHSGSNECNPDAVVDLYGFVQCDNGSISWVEVASHSYQVFPIPVSPIINQLNTSCDYEVVANCTNENLNPSSFGPLLPGEAAGVQTIMVTSSLPNHPCPAMTFSIPYVACEQLGCEITSDHIAGATDNLCDGESLNLPESGTDYQINDPNNNQLGAVTWYDGTDPSTSNLISGTTVFHSGNNTCQADIEVTIYGYVACDYDGDNIRDEWIQVASYSYQVFPDILAPTITQLNTDCAYNVVSGCLSDIISPSTFGPLSPGESGGTVTITVSSGIMNHPCGMNSFEVNYVGCATLDCQITSDFVVGATDNLCDGESLNLPESGIDYQINDPNSNQLGAVTWYDGIDPSTSNPISGTTVFHTENNTCQADIEVTIYGYVACDYDGDNIRDEWIQLASYSYQVFPDILAPTIIQLNTECAYDVVESCATDMLSPSTFGPLSPGDSGGTVTIMVTSGIMNHPCGMNSFAVNYEGCGGLDCQITSDYVEGGIDYLCDGESLNLPESGIDFIILDPNSNQLGDVNWYDGTNPSTSNPISGTTIFHSGNNTCQADSEVTIYAYIECDNDGDNIGDEWIQVASYSYQVFPDLVAPTIIQLNTECAYDVVESCATDMLSPSTFGPLSPGDSGGTVTITVTSGIINHPCGMNSFEVNYEGCGGLDCQITSDYIGGGIDYLCDGESLNLPESGIDFIILDPNSNQLGDVNWYDGTNPSTSNPISGTTIFHSGNNTCQADIEVTIYAYVECDNDGDNIGDDWIQVASYSYQVFPDVLAPEITQLNTECAYDVVESCATDMLSPSTFGPLSPGDSGGTVTIMVTSGIMNHPCGMNSFAVNYEGCGGLDCQITSDYIGGGIDNLCDGASLNLPKEGEDFNIIDQNNTQLGAVMWFDGINPENSNRVILTSVSHSGNDLCSSDELVTLYGFVQCDIDGDSIEDEWIQIANYSYYVSPEFLPPTIIGPDENCKYIFSSICDNSYEYNESELQNPLLSQITVSIENQLSDNTCMIDSLILQKQICKKRDILFGPNIFSPNDDGINDKFIIFGNSDFVEQINYFAVFSRWGELVYEKSQIPINDLNTGWDGKLKGENLEAGAYMYVAEILLRNGEVELLSGDIVLIR